jgi:hypothetical protein
VTRVTCDPGSDDFWPFAFAECPTVSLDGIEIARVLEADDLLGYVEYYPERPNGMVFVCDCGQRAIVALGFGHVEITGQRRVLQ